MRSRCQAPAPNNGAGPSAEPIMLSDLLRVWSLDHCLCMGDSWGLHGRSYRVLYEYYEGLRCGLFTIEHPLASTPRRARRSYSGG